MLDLSIIDFSMVEAAGTAIFVASLRWTPIVLLAAAAARFLPAAADRRRLWSFALLMLPLLPVLSWLAPAWSMPEWQLATGVVAEEESAAGAVTDALAAAPSVTASTGVEESSAAWSLKSGPVTSWLAVLWLLGASALLARELLARLATIALGRTAMDAPERVRQEALGAARTLGEHGQKLDVRVGEVRVPLLCGVLRPRVLLPVGSVSWPAPRLRASLLHELAHQRHRDPWLDLGARLLSAVFFFHPGVWLARRALSREMEQVADAAVVESGAFDRRTYGGILLDVARQAEPFAMAGLAMVTRRPGLETRLLALMADAPRGSWRRRLLVATSLVLLGVASAGLTVADVSESGWWQGGDGGWSLECGEDRACQAVQAEADRLLAATGHSGVLLVQKVETGELMAYAARGPAPVPQAPPASVAKLAVATLWWDGGLGDGPVRCAKEWTGPDGITVRSVRDRGELMAPHEMLIHSCSTAAGVMMQRMVAESSAEQIESELDRFGFAAGADGAWLPAFLPAPRLDEGPEWERRRPEMAAALGRVSTTPLHIASFVQAIGHDGERLTMRRPGKKAQKGERLMTAETAERLRQSMTAVVGEGTGRRAGNLLTGESWQLLGKTGTRARHDGQYDGWFAGLATDGEAPRYVIVTFLDGGGMGGGASAELAARMTKALGSLPG